MPHGKPAGVRCIHLTADLRCGIYHHPDRPAVCAGFPARQDVCGDTREEALARLAEWELLTAPLTADAALAACVAAQDETNGGASHLDSATVGRVGVVLERALSPGDV